MTGEIRDKEAAWLADLDSATNLEDLGHRTLRILVEKRGISPSHIRSLSARLAWVDGEKQTLNAAADLVSVTRERLRQVQKQLEPVQLPLSIGPRVIYNVLALLKRARSLDEFWHSVVVDEGLASSVWPSAALVELVSIFGIVELHEELESSLDRLTPLEVDSEIRSTVRQNRNKIGLINLEALSEDLDVEPRQARLAVERIYSHVQGQGKLILAHRKTPGPFIAAIVHQLKIRDALDAEILADGIRRAASSNNTPMVGDRSSLHVLIGEVAGEPCQLKNFSADIQDTVQLNAGEMWLKQVLNGARNGLRHRDQIMELALQENVNTGSVTAYLSTSPIIRRVIDGVYALVGTEVDKQDAEFLRASVINEAEKVEIEHQLISSTILALSVRVNMSVIVGGSLGLRKNIRELVEDEEFKQVCECGRLETVSRVKIVKSGFWASVNPMLTHAVTEHGLEPGHWARFHIDFEQRTVVYQLD